MTFPENERVTSTSFALGNRSCRGDYTELTANKIVYPIWADTRNGTLAVVTAGITFP
jgi:hypothetical protein